MDGPWKVSCRRTGTGGLGQRQWRVLPDVRGDRVRRGLAGAGLDGDADEPLRGAGRAGEGQAARIPPDAGQGQGGPGDGVKVQVPQELRAALTVVHPESGEATRAGTAFPSGVR